MDYILVMGSNLGSNNICVKIRHSQKTSNRYIRKTMSPTAGGKNFSNIKQVATLEFCKKLCFATKKLRKFLSF